MYTVRYRAPYTDAALLLVCWGRPSRSMLSMECRSRRSRWSVGSRNLGEQIGAQSPDVVASVPIGSSVFLALVWVPNCTCVRCCNLRKWPAHRRALYFFIFGHIRFRVHGLKLSIMLLEECQLHLYQGHGFSQLYMEDYPEDTLHAIHAKAPCFPSFQRTSGASTMRICPLFKANFLSDTYP